MIKRKILAFFAVMAFACAGLFAIPILSSKWDEDTICNKKTSELRKEGYTCIVMDDDAEDNIVIQNYLGTSVVMKLYSVDKKGKVHEYEEFSVKSKKNGYKGNPMIQDLDEYTKIYLKVIESNERKKINDIKIEIVGVYDDDLILKLSYK